MTTLPSLRQILDEAYGLSRAGQYEQSIPLAERAMTLAHEQNDDVSAAEPGLVRGYGLYFTGDYEGALEAGLSVFGVMARATTPSFLQMRAYQLLGMTHRQFGDLPSALNYYLGMLSKSEAESHDEFSARALNGIASIFATRSEPRSALPYCERALAIYRRLEDLHGQAIVLTNLSSLYADLGEYQAALEAAEASWRCYQSFGINRFPVNEVNTLRALARAELHLNRPDLAEEHALSSEAIAIAHRLEVAQAEAVLLLGDIREARGDIDGAVEHYQRALSMLESQERHRLFFESYRRLSDFYHQQGDYHQALRAFQRFHTLKAALFNEESEQRVRLLEIRHKTEAARREAEFYREQAAQVEAQRAQQQATFERIAQVRDDLIAAIRHDLLNPLTSIRMSAYLIKRSPMHDYRDRWLDNIDLQVSRVQTLLTDLLDLVKLESGLALEIKDHRLDKILTESAREFELSAHEKSILIEVESAPNLMVAVDRDRLMRALGNLITNAIKYSPSGAKITIRAALIPAAEDRDYTVQITIHDRGFGIPAEDLPYIFDRFYRVRKDEHLAVEGTGLGLSIVKAIVEQHGGQVWAESQLGKGSTFYLTLPLPPRCPRNLDHEPQSSDIP